MRILLTGVTGFIGSELLGHLTDHELLLITRRDFKKRPANAELMQADLTKVDSYEQTLKDFSPQVCIHLAWQGLPDYSWKTCLENLNSNIKLFDVLGQSGCSKLFIAGTCWEYGDALKEVKETQNTQNLSIFPSFKTAIHEIGKSLAREYDIDLIWGRIFFAYGNGQRESSLIPHCIKSLENGIAPELKSPDNINDFIHVSDVAAAIKALSLSTKASGVYNISSGVPSKVSDVVKIVARMLNKEHLVDFPESREGKGFWGNPDRLYQETGFRSQISLEDGIKKTIVERANAS